MVGPNASMIWYAGGVGVVRLQPITNLRVFPTFGKYTGHPTRLGCGLRRIKERKPQPHKPRLLLLEVNDVLSPEDISIMALCGHRLHLVGILPYLPKYQGPRMTG